MATVFRRPEEKESEAGIVQELGHSASFGGVMGREETLMWAWSEVADDGAEDSLERLVSNGKVLEKNGLLTVAGMEHLFERYGDRRISAQKRLEFGVMFLDRLRRVCPDILMAGVSGSVSYGSSGEHDDVDILLITRNGSLWRVLLQALLEARAIRKMSPGSPTLCLCYSMEETAFRKEAECHRSRLFARDFLRLRTVVGGETYRRILADSEWMRDYYPRMFDERISETQKQAALRDSTGKGNYMEYIALGGYLAIAAAFRNARFRRDGQTDRLFRAVIGKDRCIYESVKWKKLEENLDEQSEIN